jgi:hypothetical protein
MYLTLSASPWNEIQPTCEVMRLELDIIFAIEECSPSTTAAGNGQKLPRPALFGGGIRCACTREAIGNRDCGWARNASRTRKTNSNTPFGGQGKGIFP